MKLKEILQEKGTEYEMLLKYHERIYNEKWNSVFKITLDNICEDLHPKCEKWADEGECLLNPKYMVGTASLRGHCRLSCGICNNVPEVTRCEQHATRVRPFLNLNLIFEISLNFK